jgi:predicted GIY-YIG superfamily endonuclease
MNDVIQDFTAIEYYFWHNEFMGYVYLIHFERPIGKAQHYTGFTQNFERRISQHRNGEGSELTRLANEKGINWLVVRVWQDATLETEKSIKTMSTKITCPICRQKQKDLKERQVSIANMQAVAKARADRANTL